MSSIITFTYYTKWNPGNGKTLNVPVSHKVQQCLLERIDRVEHSISNHHQDHSQDKSFSISSSLTCDHPTRSKSSAKKSTPSPSVVSKFSSRTCVTSQISLSSWKPSSSSMSSSSTYSSWVMIHTSCLTRMSSSSFYGSTTSPLSRQHPPYSSPRLKWDSHWDETHTFLSCPVLQPPDPLPLLSGKSRGSWIHRITPISVTFALDVFNVFAPPALSWLVPHTTSFRLSF